MTRCFECETLPGMPSSVAPHGSLRRPDVSAGGAPENPVIHYLEYRCVVCGSRFRRNDSEGSPPDLWSACESWTTVEDHVIDEAHVRKR